MNERLLDLINGAAGRSAILDAAGRFAAKDLIFVLGATLLCLGLLEWRHSRSAAGRIALAGLFATGLALGLTTVIGRAWYEPRPFVADADTIRLVAHKADASFPSDHVAVAAAGAVVGALAWRRAAAALLLAVALVALGRVFVGVHYPGDVLAGAAIGTAAGFAGWEVSKRLPVVGQGRARLPLGPRQP